MANQQRLLAARGVLCPGSPGPACAGNRALAELEEATGKPKQILEAPELNVLATIRRAGSGKASHVLRVRAGANRSADKRLADYLIVFECRAVLGPAMPTTDQRLVRVAALRAGIREGLQRLSAHERHSEAWELCLALLIPLWRDLFALCEEVEDS